MTVPAALAAVATSLWQTALLASVVAVACRPRFGLDAARRHTLWLVTLAACAVLPPIDLAMPARTLAIAMPAPLAPLAGRPAPAASATDPASLTGEAAAPSPASAPPVRHVWRIAGAAYVAIALALLVRLGIALAGVRTAKRSIVTDDDLTRTARALSGARRSVRAGASSRFAVPCALGYAHPAISLPASALGTFDRADLGRVLRHECAHLARFDDLTKLGQEAVAALFFFNPVVHFAARAMNLERELACDDAAATLERDRVAYARCLYRMAQAAGTHTFSPSLAFTGRPSQLGLRVRRLLDGPSGAARGGSKSPMWLAGVALVALACAGSVRLTNVAIAAPPPHAPILRGASSRAATAGALANAAGRDGATNSDLRDALDAAGYRGLSSDDVDLLANHDVRPSFVRALAAAGVAPFVPDDLASLADHGVPAETVAAASALDLATSAEDLAAFADHGVRPDLIHGAVALDGARVVADDLDALADAGVSPSLLTGLADLGYRGMPLDEVVEMAEAGLTLDRVRRIVDSRIAGPHPDADTLVRIANAASGNG